MQVNYTLLRRSLYVLVAVALATATGLQANDGDWLAATIAGLGTASSILAASKTKELAEPRDPAITEEG